MIPLAIMISYEPHGVSIAVSFRYRTRYHAYYESWTAVYDIHTYIGKYHQIPPTDYGIYHMYYVTWDASWAVKNSKKCVI